YEKRRIIIRQGHPGLLLLLHHVGHSLRDRDTTAQNIAHLLNISIICRERVEVLVVNRETVMEHCPDVFHKEYEEKYTVLSVESEGEGNVSSPLSVESEGEGNVSSPLSVESEGEGNVSSPLSVESEGEGNVSSPLSVESEGEGNVSSPSVWRARERGTAHQLFKRWSDKTLRDICLESHIKELAHGKLVDPDSTASEAIYFILKGKVDMLRRLDLCAILASKASISLYDTRPLPRPSSAMPGSGKQEFVNVGSLYKNDAWDLRSVFEEGFNAQGNILVSAGVRLLKVPKARVVQLSPMGALDEFRESFVQNHRCPTDDDIYQEYMAAQSWIDYRRKVVQNVLDCKKGYDIVHMSSLSKGSSGWGPWPGK
ncbi:hypothetical protein QZH41_019040, partial [Actinostola sp. cb2023]